MTLTTQTQQLLDRLRQLLPMTEDEIVQRGITEAATSRMVELRKRATQLAESYKTLASLEARVKTDVTPSDHTLFTDLLEWRAVQHELGQLAGFLGAV